MTLQTALLLCIAEMTFFKYIGQMDPAEVCMMVGTCLDAAVARVGKPVPLQAQSVAAVGKLMAAAGQVQGLMQAANPSNDHCDTCKVRLRCRRFCVQLVCSRDIGAAVRVAVYMPVLRPMLACHAVEAARDVLCLSRTCVTNSKSSCYCTVHHAWLSHLFVCFIVLQPQVVITEMHQLVANPQIQVQLVDYAKQACALVPSFADSCQADVDQYAPMLFGMVLAYLQPEQVRKSTVAVAFAVALLSIARWRMVSWLATVAQQLACLGEDVASLLQPCAPAWCWPTCSQSRCAAAFCCCSCASLRGALALWAQGRLASSGGATVGMPA
jgi:hypothetical protein